MDRTARLRLCTQVSAVSTTIPSDASVAKQLRSMTKSNNNPRLPISLRGGHPGIYTRRMSSPGASDARDGNVHMELKSGTSVMSTRNGTAKFLIFSATPTSTSSISMHVSSQSCPKRMMTTLRHPDAGVCSVHRTQRVGGGGKRGGGRESSEPRAHRAGRVNEHSSQTHTYTRFTKIHA